MNPARKYLAGGALALAAVAGGAIGSQIVGVAGAQTSTNSSTSSSSSTAADSTQPSMPAHGSADHESAEKAVTGDAATKAQTAAVTSVGSGTAGDVTTDFTGNGYEVTVTKSDGTQIEIHLDSSFNVQQGGPGGHGPRANDNDADDAATSSSSSTSN